MKYNIKLMCGHVEQFDLFGKSEERQRRATWIGNNRLCKRCYQREKERQAIATCKLATIAYCDYKTIFSDCLKKDGSYDPDTGTIAVYIPYEQWDIYTSLTEKMPEFKVRETISEAKRKYGDNFWFYLKSQ